MHIKSYLSLDCLVLVVKISLNLKTATMSHTQGGAHKWVECVFHLLSTPHLGHRYSTRRADGVEAVRPHYSMLNTVNSVQYSLVYFTHAHGAIHCAQLIDKAPLSIEAREYISRRRESR